MYAILKKENCLAFFMIGVSVLLCACENSKNDHHLSNENAQAPIQHNPSADQSLTVQELKAKSAVQDQAEGRKLSEVAGQAALPKSKDDQSEKLSKQALQFVGRYHALIPCDDPFAKCSEGTAEFIINLLPDGTAHRTFVYMGKITNENNKDTVNRVQQENTWFYDQENHQIVIHRIEGIQIFYKVGDHNNLVMDVDQILNSSEANKLYFQEHHIAPMKAYVLTKFEP